MMVATPAGFLELPVSIPLSEATGVVESTVSSITTAGRTVTIGVAEVASEVTELTSPPHPTSNATRYREIPRFKSNSFFGLTNSK